MILIDSGPLIAAFNPNDADHAPCERALRALDEEGVTTAPVLTEVFHLLPRRASKVEDLVSLLLEGPLTVAPMEDSDLRRSLELMVQYADAPMDFADASLVALGERSGFDRVLTLDRRHFATYRMRRGYRHVPFTVVGPHLDPPVVRETGDPEAGYRSSSASSLDAGGDTPDNARGRHLAESALRDAREALDRLQQALGA